MVRGAITQEDAEFVESWRNCSPSQNYIIRIDARGDEQHVLVPDDAEFMLTTEERIITQSRIVDRANDPFLNGCFRPVVVPDNITLETNPNAMSDEDIRRVLKASDVAWQEYMRVIDSPATLTRMKDLADEMARNDEDLSLRRYKHLEQRLNEVRPKRRVTQKDREQYENLAPSPGSSATGGRAQEVTL